MTTLSNLSPWDVEVIKHDGSSMIIEAPEKPAYVKACGKILFENSPNKEGCKIKVVGLPKNRVEDWTFVPQIVVNYAKDKNKLLVVYPPLLGQTSKIKLPS